MQDKWYEFNDLHVASFQRPPGNTLTSFKAFILVYKNKNPSAVDTIRPASHSAPMQAPSIPIKPRAEEMTPAMTPGGLRIINVTESPYR